MTDREVTAINHLMAKMLIVERTVAHLVSMVSDDYERAQEFRQAFLATVRRQLEEGFAGEDGEAANALAKLTMREFDGFESLVRKASGEHGH